MPSFRGLDVSVSVQPRSQRLPEFPHPDGSSVRVLVSFDSASLTDNKRSSVSTFDSNRLQKANPRTSVYIPSIPGSQFTIEYAIVRNPEPACQFYFKLFINGRHITSWGVNPSHQSSGTISRALYEPCERWHYQEDGTMFKTEGIESRSFFFSPSPTTTGGSVADDGGLIEVHAYRARGRRRRTMMLERFRSQDRYGILSPSSGLLERPEATSYFDWDLIDPKDSPFASFRFHYRDWNLLHQLSLIPSESQSLAESYPLSPTAQEPSYLEQSENSSSDVMCDPKSGVLVSSRSPTPLAFWHTATASSSQDLPDKRPRSVSAADPPDVSGLSRKSSESLATSIAPSIAPSLLPYLEDSSDESSAEFGTAIGLQFHDGKHSGTRSQRPLPEIPKRHAQNEDSHPESGLYHDRR